MQNNTQRSLNIHGLILIGFLVIQYVLGMMTNLYVQFPEGKKEGQEWVFAWTHISSAVHMTIGILLGIGALVLHIKAQRQKNRTWIITSGIAFGAILIAIIAGVKFIPGQEAIYSLVMAFGFIIALLSYMWGLLVAKKN